MNVCFITDPLVTTVVAVRPALLLAKQFNKTRHNVTLVTSRSSEKIGQSLQAEDIHVKEVGPTFSFVRSFPTFDAWARGLIRHNLATEICDSDIVINTSSSIMVRAHAYYAQGPMTRTLDGIFPDMPLHYKYTYRLLKSSLKMLERGLIEKTRRLSRLFIANSEFCASMYKEWGVKVDAVVNPPLDCSFFKPVTSNPTADYVLTCSGIHEKEGRMSIIKKVADAGIKIKVFGDFSSAPRSLTRHSNIDFFGIVSGKELVHLYSNALYTLFAFNHEPFGYIPAESMACGTPVLTFNRQGPAEIVTDFQTGWLVETDEELVKTAKSIWEEGVDRKLRDACRKKALGYDVKTISKKWIAILERAK